MSKSEWREREWREQEKGEKNDRERERDGGIEETRDSIERILSMLKS